MTKPMTITKQVHFQSARRGRKVLAEGRKPTPVSPGRVPRLARLMALAIHMDDFLRRGVVGNFADLARLALVTRARMTQVMNLLLLAPEIQEEILFLPLTHEGRDMLSERAIRSVASIPDWRKQRAIWWELKSGRQGAEKA